MPFPDYYKITKGEVADLKDAARLLDGETIVYSWESYWFILNGNDVNGNDVHNLECPSLIHWIKPLVVKFADRDTFCGFVQTTLVAGSAEYSTDHKNDSERKVVFGPDDQYGNKAMRVMVPRNEEVLKRRNTLWTTRPPKVDDWLTIVESAESSARDFKQLPK